MIHTDPMSLVSGTRLGVCEVTAQIGVGSSTRDEAGNERALLNHIALLLAALFAIASLVFSLRPVIVRAAHD